MSSLLHVLSMMLETQNDSSKLNVPMPMRYSVIDLIRILTVGLERACNGG